jgi:hypothetical protein
MIFIMLERTGLFSFSIGFVPGSALFPGARAAERP